MTLKSRKSKIHQSMPPPPPERCSLLHSLKNLLLFLHPRLSPDLLNAWVYAIAVEDWADLAVVIEEHQMAHVECGERSPGDAVTEGWNCLFLPMPHLCTFDTGAVRPGRGRRLPSVGRAPVRRGRQTSPRKAHFSLRCLVYI